MNSEIIQFQRVCKFKSVQFKYLLSSIVFKNNERKDKYRARYLYSYITLRFKLVARQGTRQDTLYENTRPQELSAGFCFLIEIFVFFLLHTPLFPLFQTHPLCHIIEIKMVTMKRSRNIDK